MSTVRIPRLRKPKMDQRLIMTIVRAVEFVHMNALKKQSQ